MSISKNKLAGDIEKKQTIEPAAQQDFQPTWKPMGDDLLMVYAAFKEPLAQEFHNRFLHQQEQLSLPAKQMTESQELLQTAAPVQTPTQPPLSAKDQKKLRKEMNKKKKAGLKLTPGATCYTIDLIEQMKKDVAGRENIFEYLSRANTTVSSPSSYEGTPEESQKKAERATHRFGALLYFGPQIELDPETQGITEASKQQQLDFLDDCVNRPQKVMKEFKEKMFSRTFSPEKYTPDYVGKHFREILEEQQQLKGFVALFREGTPEYESLTPYEKIQIGSLADFYEKSDVAFRSALQANGLKYTNSGLIPMTQEELDQRRDNPTDVEALRQSMESMNDRKKKYLDKESERIIGLLSQAHKDEYDNMRERKAREDGTSFITSNRLTQEIQYESIRDAKELIEKYINSTQYNANRELINNLFNEIVNLEELCSSNYERSRIIHLACSVPQKVTDENGNEKEEIIVKDAALQEVLQNKSLIAEKKSEALRFRIQCIKSGLEHLLEGNPMSNSVARILSEFGYKDPAYEEKSRSTSDYGKAYAKNYKMRETLFALTIKSKDFSPFEADLLLSLININKLDYLTGCDKIIDLIVLLKNHRSEIGEDTSKIPLKTRKAVKDLIKPYIEEIEKFDVMKWSQLSEEELISHQEELMNIALPGMALSFMGKFPDPDDPSISIAEALIGKEKQSSFSLKYGFAQGYMMKARALAMIASYKNGTLKEDSLLPFESDIALDEKTREVTEDSMLAFAKQQYIEATNLIEGVRNRVANDPSAKEYFINLGFNDFKLKNSLEYS